MTQFRKRPIVIEAEQYAGKGNLVLGRGSAPDWIWEAFERGVLRSTNGTDPLKIVTLEGELTVPPNWWIIRGVKGELYPCDPDAFDATYERVFDATYEPRPADEQRIKELEAELLSNGWADTAQEYESRLAAAERVVEAAREVDGYVPQLRLALAAYDAAAPKQPICCGGIGCPSCAV